MKILIRVLKLALRMAFGFLSLCFNVSTTEFPADLRVALDITNAVSKSSPELNFLLNSGNQYGYYTTDYPIKTISDVVDVTRVISQRQRIPSDAKLIISFTNLTSFQPETNSANNNNNKPRRTQIEPVKLPDNIYGLVFTELKNVRCDGDTLRLRDKLYQPIQQLTAALKPVKIGIGHKIENIRCKYISFLARASEFAIVIITLQNRLNFPESYTLFKALMDDHHASSSSSHHNSQTNNIIYLVKLEKAENTSEEELEFQEYASLLEEFASKWAKASGASLILDLADYRTLGNIIHRGGGSRAVQADVAGPSTFVVPNWRSDRDMVGPGGVSNDSYPFAFHTISSTFRSLVLSYKNLESVVENWQNSLDHWPYTIRLSSPLELIVEVWDPYEKSLRERLNKVVGPLTQFSSQLEVYNVKIKLVELVMWDYWNMDLATNMDLTASEMKMLVGKMGNMKVGCAIGVREWNMRSVQDFVSKTEMNCGSLFENGSNVKWRYVTYAHIDISYDTYATEIKPLLNTILQARTKLLQTKPNATFSFEVTRSVLPEYESDNIKTENLYCNESLSMRNAFFEAMFNWGRIHKFPTSWKEAFDTDYYNARYGWWSQIEPGPEIAQEIAVVPHFVMRNHPNSIVSWKTDACIEWSSESPPEGIQFSREFCGVIIRMDADDDEGHHLTPKEMLTVLVLSWKKFGSLEILADSKDMASAAKQVNVLRSALSVNNLDALLEVNGIPNGSLFLQVPVPKKDGGGGLQGTQLMREVGSLAEMVKEMDAISLEGIHFANWETLSKQELADLVKLLRDKHDVQVGLSIKNCSALLNSLPHLPNRISLLSTVNYILCQTSPIAAQNEKTEFAPIMDSQLYLSSAFSNFHLNLRIHFRLNTYPCCEDDEEQKTSNMLRFLNDVNQFAAGYEIKYFLVEALIISHHGSINNTTGWWRVTDLADVSSYVDVEAEYRNAPTWRPELNVSIIPVLLLHPEEATTWDWVYYASGTFGLLVLVIFAICAIPHIGRIPIRLGKKKSSSLLSDYEVEEFLNGSSAVVRFAPATNHANIIGKEENDYNMLKFDNKYSINKSDFKFSDNCELLGSGNFGKVVRAELGESTVAVKIPHDGCPKESLKSMLSEVKVMSYIGVHPNVATFVGAYIREIRNGIIYIATELCENGSLIGYLRSRPRSDYVSPDNRMLCVRELVRFALEIASGMEYIGSRNVVHGDLAARNILLDADNTCKITDFGLSRKLYEYNKYVKSNQEPLPWRWMAHESLTRMEFTTMSDVWSYGITLWEIFSLGDTPYPGLAWNINFADEIRDGLRLPKPRLCESEMYSRMSACWNLCPEVRPTFTTLKEYVEDEMSKAYASLQ